MILRIVILLAFLQRLEAIINYEFNITLPWSNPLNIKVEDSPRKITITGIRWFDDDPIATVFVKVTLPSLPTSPTLPTWSWSESTTEEVPTPVTEESEDTTTTTMQTETPWTMPSTEIVDRTEDTTNLTPILLREKLKDADGRFWQGFRNIKCNVIPEDVFFVNMTLGKYYNRTEYEYEFEFNMTLSSYYDTNATQNEYKMNVTFTLDDFSQWEEITPIFLEDFPETSTTTTRRPDYACERNCTGREENGQHWEVCAGDTGKRACDETHPEAEESVIWKCSIGGYVFETERPDYSNCRSKWVGELEKDLENVVDLRTALFFLRIVRTEVKLPGDRSNIFGHEIPFVLNLTEQVVELASEYTALAGEYKQVANHTANIAGRLVTDLDPWRQLSVSQRATIATPLIGLIEKASLLLSRKAIVVTDSNETRRFEEILTPRSLFEEFFVESLAYSKMDEELNELDFPRTHGSPSIFMPKGWMSLVPGKRVDIVVIRLNSIYTNTILQEPFRLGLKTDEKMRQIINGHLMTITVGNEDSKPGIGIEFPNAGVKIVFKHDLDAWGKEAYDVPRDLLTNEHPKVAKGSASCLFWNTTFNLWSPKGCRVVASSDLETTCECDHLTSFAVLADVHNYVGKDFGLEIITLVLCPLSIVCLIFTIFVLTTVRALRSRKSKITLQLSLSLLVGNLMVLVLVDRNYLNSNEGVCIAAGIITHYFFLAAFAWMAIEGIHFYHSVVTVFEYTSSPTRKFMLVAYLSPVVLIGITLGFGYGLGDKPYGGELFCWLQGFYNWAFLAPVLFVIVTNFVLVGLWKIKEGWNSTSKLSSSAMNTLAKEHIRCRVKGYLMLTGLMGLAWIIGFFVFLPEIPGLIFSYLFTIFNASQGIYLFLSNCVLNKGARQGFLQQYGNWYVRLFKKPTPSTDNGSRNHSGTEQEPGVNNGQPKVSGPALKIPRPVFNLDFT